MDNGSPERIGVRLVIEAGRPCAACRQRRFGAGPIASLALGYFATQAEADAFARRVIQAAEQELAALTQGN